MLKIACKLSPELQLGVMNMTCNLWHCLLLNEVIIFLILETYKVNYEFKENDVIFTESTYLRFQKSTYKRRNLYVSYTLFSYVIFKRNYFQVGIWVNVTKYEFFSSLSSRFLKFQFANTQN